jgi:hypothetical protein
MLSADENLTYNGCIARLKEEEAWQQKVAVAITVSPGMRKSSGSRTGGPLTDQYPCSHCGQKEHWCAQCPQQNGGHSEKGKGSKNGQNRSDGGNQNSK